METALVSLISMSLVIIGTVTMAMSAFQSAGTLAESWKQMEAQAGDMRQTEIIAVPPESYNGGTIFLVVENGGQTNLDSFSSWDVIAQYQNGNANYIDYDDDATYPPDSNEWAVEGIYLSDNVTPEVFDPGILNPGEKMIVAVKLNPEIGEGETGRITISTPNGVTSECQITRPVPP